ncbi:transcription antitermination factor NusB [Paracholeplasma manati]|jgi:N utilization substance protein B|uniref:Transcription antitermination protein NusB n=1 Tax=Paracholeplasma manati TaxID=591373 RepID=A0ABT2Y5B4_9MOLU|nr:transcription antitermination factor NusB [Paracholeplasma manati]MCV2231939.1 transcription antitermination factor NusB [Paracholeplasma manati]MDG0888908.1 transcription antitermination factor NusB [Paracholeplasma manati]MDX9807547.1 transcription antitermination factor NusB [Acholeplasma sp.]
MQTRHEIRIETMTFLYQQDLRGDIVVEPFKESYDLYHAVLAHLAEIDQLIKDTLVNYTIERLSFVDRAIIRLAVYEMMYTDTPKPIVINEAIKLTKAYSNLEDEKQSAFTNRLLDNISKRLG